MHFYGLVTQFQKLYTYISRSCIPWRETSVIYHWLSKIVCTYSAHTQKHTLETLTLSSSVYHLYYLLDSLA